MKLEPLKNKTAMIRRSGKITLKRSALVCLLAYVLIGCTTLSSSDPTTASVSPNAGGWFSISGLPVGQHSLRLIYSPDSDTVSQLVTICPGRDVSVDFVFPADLW